MAFDSVVQTANEVIEALSGLVQKQKIKCCADIKTEVQ